MKIVPSRESVDGQDEEILSKILEAKIKPNPDLGQHFLINSDVLRRINNYTNKNEVVIEVGAGPGQLTKYLAGRARKVIAFEIDNQFKPILKEQLSRYSNVEIIYEDVLDKLFKKTYNSQNKHSKVRIFGNLPYNITEPFILSLIHLPDVDAILMVGKKFGFQSQNTDFTDPDYSFLSFVCGSFFKVDHIMDVQKDEFWPIPRTDSMVISLKSKKSNHSDRISFLKRELILDRENGTKIKNSLLNAMLRYQDFLKEKYKTKNEIREEIKNLELSDIIYNKSLSQLNNEEIKVLVTQLQKLTK